MSTEEIDEFEVHGEKVGVVRDFVFLGAKIDDSGSCKGEILRRLALGRAAMTGLSKIWKDKDITITTKCRIVNALVFPVVLYGCESWTIRKVERRIMDSFELRCWRRLLRIPWTARRTNKSGIEEIKVTNPLLALEALIKKQQLPTVIFWTYHAKRKQFGKVNYAGNGWRYKKGRQTTGTLARWHQGHNKLHTRRTMRFGKRSRRLEEDDHGNHQKSDATWGDTVTRWYNHRVRKYGMTLHRL